MSLLCVSVRPLARLATVLTFALMGTASLDDVRFPLRNSPDARLPIATEEVARIRFHFSRVATQLDRRDLTALSERQRAARADLLSALRSYRDRGDFPHNYDFPDVPTTYFVDRKTGTRCAVAHLLDISGRDDIVQRVAHSDNNVLVPALAGDTAFVAWLDAHGLTLAEAARIQVPYVTTQETSRQVRFSIMAPLSITTAAVASTWNAWGNADGRRRSGAIVGFTAGVLATALSASVLTQNDANSALRGVGGAGAAIGALSIGLATRSWRRHDQPMAAARARLEASPRLRAEPTARITPLIPMNAQSGAGLAMSIRF